MTTRQMLGYLLLVLLLAGAAFVVWRTIYNSEHNVRRRGRRERRARYKADLERQEQAPGEEAGAVD